MAYQRATRVAEAVKAEVASILLTRLKDSRVDSSRVSVVNVQMTGDLRHATIFVSVLGDEAQQKEVLQGLRSASGFIRSEVGKAVSLRATPDLHWKLDHSIEHGANIMALLNRIKEEETAKETTSGGEANDA